MVEPLLILATLAVLIIGFGLVLENQRTLTGKITAMASQLENLEAGVNENTDAVESAVKLLDNLSAELEAAGTDPDKLANLVNTLRNESGRLAAAVARNTPKAPESMVHPPEPAQDSQDNTGTPNDNTPPQPGS